MKIAIGQINPIVGDIDGNSEKILAFSRKAFESQASLAIFPELSLIGYPPKDLLLRADFLDRQIVALQKIANSTPLPIIVGAAIKEDLHKAPFNAAMLCHNGHWSVATRKCLLPNYNVFDEKRYFRAPEVSECNIMSIGSKKILLSICEDAWAKEFIEGLNHYTTDPIYNALSKCETIDAIVNMSASPYTISKPKTRERIFSSLAKTYKTTVIVAGQVGANDQLLFDGQSMVINREGQIVAAATPCVEELLIFDLGHSPFLKPALKSLNEDQLLLEALTMGIRDYVEKCRMLGVIIGVSGGIDSAVCLALSVRALGRDRVRAVFLPSRFSSDESFDLARLLTRNLGLELSELPIEDAVNSIRNLLAGPMSRASIGQKDISDQNLQSRLRGLIIMALTNLSDYLMIATSNKSELSVGYSTIYGDMCGALSAIGDLYKTQVWKLAHFINKEKEIIPYRIISRPPTAELKAKQLDTDNLPEFAVLDQILFNYIDLEKSAQEIEDSTRFARTLIDETISKISGAEYKRRQAPFPLMVSDKVFGDARRLPMAKKLSP